MMDAQEHDQDSRREPETTIEAEGDGCYGLYLDGALVVHIGPTYANPLHRECHWKIYGPLGLDKSIALMKGFLHLTALLAGDARAYASQPTTSENGGTPPKEKRKWQTSRTIRKSKTSPAS
jgi:hypothetical protein